MLRIFGGFASASVAVQLIGAQGVIVKFCFASIVVISAFLSIFTIPVALWLIL